MFGILQGGLGNQLFILAAVLKHDEHATFSEATNDIYGPSVTARQSYQTTLLAWVPRQPHPYQWPLFVSPDMNGLASAFAVQHKTRYLGYFQDIKWAWPVPIALAKPMRLQYETWLSTHPVDFTVAIHIRRTDYTQLTGVYHQLGAAYYKQALLALQGLLGAGAGAAASCTIRVVSDDPSIMTEIESWQLDAFGRIVCEPQTDEDAFWTLTAAPHLIMANSTFSWWAGALGTTFQKKTVLAPLQWYRTMDSSPLRCPHWTWL